MTDFIYPEMIEVHENSDYANHWQRYKKLHTYMDGDTQACYYIEDGFDEGGSPVTSQISMYPDGHLTFLWNGTDNKYDAEWRKCKNRNLEMEH